MKVETWLPALCVTILSAVGGVQFAGLFEEGDNGGGVESGPGQVPSAQSHQLDWNVSIVLRNGPTPDSGPWTGTGAPYIAARHFNPTGGLDSLLQHATVKPTRGAALDACPASLEYDSFYPSLPQNPNPSDQEVVWASDSYTAPLTQSGPWGDRCAIRADRTVRADITLCVELDGALDGAGDSWDRCFEATHEAGLPA